MNRVSRLLLLATIGLGPAQAIADQNRLSEQERQDGWILLFDGKTTKGWMTPKRGPLPKRHVQQGALNPHPCDYMLVHEKLWGDFILSLDVKISTKCNSGVFFRTFPLKAKPGKDVGWNGMEIAIDDTRTNGFHDTGAIYDLVRPAKNAMKPVGEWNRIVLTCRGSRVDVSVNGQHVSKMNLDRWTKPGLRADGTQHKFQEIAYAKHPRQGFIGLQDHGSDCWFRNIKLKPLTK